MLLVPFPMLMVSETVTVLPSIRAVAEELLVPTVRLVMLAVPPVATKPELAGALPPRPGFEVRPMVKAVVVKAPSVTLISDPSAPPVIWMPPLKFAPPDWSSKELKPLLLP